MKKTVVFIILILFIISSCATKPGFAPVALNEPAGVTYDTFVASREDFFVVDKYPGYVVAKSEALYFTKGGMPVKSIDAAIGAYVKKGDPLVTLETESIEKQITELEEYIEELKTRNGFANKIKETDIAIAVLELAAARRGGNESEITRREYAFDRLELELKQTVETQEQELGRQTGKLAELYSQLEGTVIYAPFDGRVVQIETRKYNWAQAYRPVVYLADETKLEVLYSGRDSLSSSRNATVRARIGETDYDVKYKELPTDEFLRYIIAGTVPPSLFEFLEPDGKIKPGQFVSLSVITRSETDVVVVPVNSIYRGETDEGSHGAYVYVIENGQKIPRSVELGYSNDSFYFVKSGIEEGEIIFVKQ